MWKVACDVCLEASDSPSAVVNASNKGLARNVDADFVELVSRVAEEVQANENNATHDEAIRKINAMHGAIKVEIPRRLDYVVSSQLRSIAKHV